MSTIILFNPPAPAEKQYIREGRCTQEAGIWGTQWPPVTLASAAALLEKDGHLVRAFDFPAIGRNAGDLQKILLELRPDFAFWTTGTPTLQSDLAVGRLLKNVSPLTVTGVMGTHVTVRPEEALHEAAIDLVVRGEPEAVIREICGKTRADWPLIRGISYRTANGEYQHNQEAGFLAAPEIPAPAWQTLSALPYRLPFKGRPFLIVAPIRGCPFPCSFCTASIYYGRQLRKRPVSQVLDEIETNISQLRISDFFIWADTFTADKKYVAEFCEEILQRRLMISWTCNSRVDTVDRQLLALMKRAGAWMISFGLESADDEILKKTGKGITAAQSRAAVSAARQTGIRTAGHFILGLPGETPASMQKTLNFALSLPLDIAQFYAAAPFPGTRLYQEAREQGWLLHDSLFSQGQAAMNLPGLSPTAVDQFRQHAYRKFYLRPTTILRLLAMLRPGAILPLAGKLMIFLGNLLKK